MVEHGVVATVIGIVVPLALGAASLIGGSALLLLGVIGGASLVGDFYVRYSIVRAGVYVPLQGTGIPAAGGNR